MDGADITAQLEGQSCTDNWRQECVITFDDLTSDEIWQVIAVSGDDASAALGEGQYCTVAGFAMACSSTVAGSPWNDVKSDFTWKSYSAMDALDETVEWGAVDFSDNNWQFAVETESAFNCNGCGTTGNGDSAEKVWAAGCSDQAYFRKRVGPFPVTTTSTATTSSTTTSTTSTTSTTEAPTVTCAFTLDNYVGRVFVDGADITAQLEGQSCTDNWRQECVITFDDLTSDEIWQVIAVSGDDASAALGEGQYCTVAGFAMACSSTVAGSPWNDVKSDFTWKSYSAMDALDETVEWGAVDFSDNSWQFAVETESAFNCNGCGTTGNGDSAEKVWAAGCSDQAYFRKRVGPFPATTTTMVAVEHLVTCDFTADNTVKNIFLDGNDITSEVSNAACLSDWQQTCSITFPDLTSDEVFQVLAVYADDASNNLAAGQYCAVAGLAMICYSDRDDSPWNDVVADDSWKTQSSMSEYSLTDMLDWAASEFNDRSWAFAEPSFSRFTCRQCGPAGDSDAGKMWGAGCNDFSFFRKHVGPFSTTTTVTPTTEITSTGADATSTAAPDTTTAAPDSTTAAPDSTTAALQVAPTSTEVGSPANSDGVSGGSENPGTTGNGNGNAGTTPASNIEVGGESTVSVELDPNAAGNNNVEIDAGAAGASTTRSIEVIQLGTTTEAFNIPNLNAAVASASGSDGSNSPSCVLFCDATATEMVSTSVNVAAASSVAVAVLSGSAGATAVTLVAALSHAAMMAKLDVLVVRTPEFVEVNDAFSLFNLQGLPVPFALNATTVVPETRRFLLEQGESATTSASPDADTVGNISDCYSANGAAQTARTVQKLANVRNVAAKFAQLESNVFYVLLAFAAAAVLQLLFFSILRAVVFCRVRQHQKQISRLNKFAMNVLNTNRMRGQDNDSATDTKRQNVSSSGSAPQDAQRMGCCARMCQGCTMRVVESLIAMVLMRKQTGSFDGDGGEDDPNSPRKRLPLPSTSPRSSGNNNSKPQNCRDVLNKFVLQDGDSMSTMTVKGTTSIYLIILLAVYQGVCESSAFVLSLSSADAKSGDLSLTSEAAAASVVAFTVVVGLGMVAVWAVLLTCVRPQQLAQYEDGDSKWVGTDKHQSLLQHAGNLFARHRFGAGRFVFTGVWMFHLVFLALILALSSGELQLYLMMGNEAWLGLLYFAWQPYPLRTPACGGCCSLNYNILGGVEKVIMLVVLGLAAFYPVEDCEPFPEWMSWVMISLALIPAVVPLCILVGSAIVFIHSKCTGRSVRGSSGPDPLSLKKLRISPMATEATTAAARRTLREARGSRAKPECALETATFANTSTAKSESDDDDVPMAKVAPPAEREHPRRRRAGRRHLVSSASLRDNGEIHNLEANAQTAHASAHNTTAVGGSLFSKSASNRNQEQDSDSEGGEAPVAPAPADSSAARSLSRRPSASPLKEQRTRRRRARRTIQTDDAPPGADKTDAVSVMTSAASEEALEASMTTLQPIRSRRGRIRRDRHTIQKLASPVEGVERTVLDGSVDTVSMEL